jgi:hypothetical protein
VVHCTLARSVKQMNLAFSVTREVSHYMRSAPGG